MTKPELLALFQRLLDASDPAALTQEERDLLAAHLVDLKEQSRTPKSQAKQALGSNVEQTVSDQVLEVLERHGQLANADDETLATGLHALIDHIETLSLNKPEALALASRILPDARRYRSRTDALAAVRARLMQRYRDAVRTAKLAGQGPPE